MDDIGIVLGVEGLSSFVADLARADAATAKATDSMIGSIEGVEGAAKAAFQDMKMPAASGSIDAYTEELNKLKQQFSAAGTEIERAAIGPQIAALDAEIKKANKAIPEFSDKLPHAAGSVDDLSEKLDELKKQWRATGSAMEQANLGNQIASLETEIANAEKTIPKATKSMGESISEFASEYAAAFGAVAVGAVVAFGKESVAAFMEFETGMKSLESITGATGEQMVYLGDRAKTLGLEIEGGATSALKGFELIGSARPELLNDATALAALTEEAITFSLAAGLDLPSAATALTDALNQFGEPASAAAKYMDVLAAGANYGAATIPQATEALLQFGSGADAFNVSIEESIALVQQLSLHGLKGAEAGVKARNILGKLDSVKGLGKDALDSLKAAGVDLDIVSSKTIPLADRLEEMKKIFKDSVGPVKVFGEENKNAAQSLFSNIDQFRDLEKNMHAVGLAQKQAAINTDTLAHSFLEIKNQIGVFMLEIGAAIAPVLRVITEGFTPAWESAKQTLITIYTPMIDIGKNLMELGKALGLSAGEGNAFVGIVDGIGVALKIVTLPMRIIYTEFNLIIKAVTWAVNAFKDARQAIIDFGDRVPVIGALIDGLLGPIKGVIDGIGMLNDGLSAVFGGGAADEITNSSKAFIAMRTEAFKVAEQMGATNEQVIDFSKNLQASQYAGLSMADTAAKLKMDFAAYLESLKATNAETEAGIAPADAFAAAIGGVGGKAIPAAGSIDYLNAKIGELEKSYNAATDGVARAKLDLQIQKLKFELDAAGGSLDTFKSKIGALEEFSKSVSDVTKLPTRAIDSLGDALAIDAPLDAATDKFTLFAATVSDTFKGLKDGIKGAMVQIGADLAFGIGEAIAMGGSVGDVFKAAVREMLVQVPKMAGMALLNAAAFPANAPIALPLAAIGLGLLGLSGIISGLFKGADAKKAKQSQSLAQESGARAPAASGQLGLSAFVDNSDMAAQIGSSVAQNLVGGRLGLSIGGKAFEAEIYEINKRNNVSRGK